MSISLPPDFVAYTSALFGRARWDLFEQSFREEIPVSIRLNPWKKPQNFPFEGATPVAWCPEGYFLKTRPNFTLDPLFHAGAYYVQEAGSMFLDYLVRGHIQNPVLALDLCAAPGGKSTLLRAALPQGSLLVSNEPDRRRANILLENMLKQGHPDVLVTHNRPADFARLNWQFDVILTDVPCSGEGLFRRDEKTIRQWSVPQVHFCQQRQRQILREIWPCLKNGGLLIYSTCTFNTHENEENVRFIAQELGAEVLPLAVPPAWQITGSLLENWNEPVYRFISGLTPSEGFFIAVLRKKGEVSNVPLLPDTLRRAAQKTSLIHLLSDGLAQPELKGKEKIPSAAQALSLNLPPQPYPRAELSLEQAQRYLRRETITLPKETPLGFVLVTYQQMPLGFVKNVGTRANNLYPKNWAIHCL